MSLPPSVARRVVVHVKKRTIPIANIAHGEQYSKHSQLAVGIERALSKYVIRKIEIHVSDEKATTSKVLLPIYR